MFNEILFILILMILKRGQQRQNNKVFIKFNIKDENNIPIKDARVSIRVCNSNKVINIITNCRGVGLFKGIYKSTYKVTICKYGYRKKIFTINAHKNINCNIYLCHRNSNRIYGYVTDLNNKAVNRAIVVLYKVISKKIYIPKKFTYTDFTGEYNFFNVPKGKYIIKALK